MGSAWDAELAGLSDEASRALAERTTIFARLSPADKEAIIQCTAGERACGRVHGRWHRRCARAPYR